MVAIMWNPDAYDTSGKALMGRHAAGEGFMRGYIRHGSAPELTFWNGTNQTPEQLEPLARAIEPTGKPIRWIGRGDFHSVARAGVLNLPVPGITEFAWTRQLGDPRQFSICGVTHTTVTGKVLDLLVDMTIGPARPWDALVCTSRAVKASIDAQNEMVDAYLKERLGATRTPRPQYAVIPLGVNTDEFAPDPAHRKSWRERLDIPDDDVAVLYVGRFNLSSKMNPVIMALALERAAAGTRPVHWILAGWADEAREAEFKSAVEAHCQHVRVHWVDGRPAENRRSIWSAGDIFISLSDNVQETFGLTPVEAMAAGMPVVVSDWDGYKDTVRHGVDGFRIPTFTPSSGLGRDLALGYARDWVNYDTFTAAVAQLTAVDLDAAARALRELIDNPDLRRRMGVAGQARARSTFDWSRIIPQYEALWDELDARRKAAPEEPAPSRNAADNPWRPDPFRMFAGYATEWATSTTMLAAAPGMDWAAAEALMAKPLVRLLPQYLPTNDEVKQILEALHQQPQLELGDLLQRFPGGRRPFLERGVVWMAKYGLLRLLGRSNHIPN